MAVEIPPEVADFLDCCGVRYPDIDEGDVRGLAVKVRTFAANTRGSGIPESGDALAAYERLAASWAGSADDHQAELDRVCAIIAKALDAVAYVITVTKAVVLTELAALATTYAAMTATPAARITGPLVTAAAHRLCTQMERALIGYLVIEVIGRAVEPLGRSVDRLFTGAVSSSTSLPEPASEPQPPGATSVEPQLPGVPPTEPPLPAVASAEPQEPTVTSAELPMSGPAAGSEMSGATSGEVPMSGTCPAGLQLPATAPTEPQTPAEPQLPAVTPAEPRMPSAASVEPQLPATTSGESRMPGVDPGEAQKTAVTSGESLKPVVTPGNAQMPEAAPDEPQIPGVTPAQDPAAPNSGVVQSGRVGPRMQPPLGPSRSRGFVTPWAHAVRASAQRAAFSKGVPSKAFQTLDRRATTARKPRETPWSKLARQSEAASGEMAVTVPTVRRREDGGR